MPLFITTGEKIKVDTRDGRYLGRVLSHGGACRRARAAQSPQARARLLYEADLRDVTPREVLAERREPDGRRRRTT